MTKKPFKILSIDGGGIKGLYSAIVLEHIEEEFCKKEGKCISDYFDMICGTSTGGLIALALSLKIPASQIATFYKEQGDKIFPNHTFIKRQLATIKQSLWRGKYNNKSLKNELEAILEDKVMGDSNNLLCIPSFNIINGTPKMWKFPHKEGNFSKDRYVKMVDVALSTSAAPTYFPAHEIEEHGRFIDGGVWANNPTLCGVQEAIQYFINTPLSHGEVHFDTLQVLSISSVNKPIAKSLRERLNKSFFDLKSEIFDPFFKGQSFFTDKFMINAISNMYKDSVYHRIPSPDLSHHHLKDIDIDVANKYAIKHLIMLGKDVGGDYCAAKRNLIEPFFKNLKTYKTI